ncbi:MAG TPA: dipeptidase [Micropepsaceae bacterium]|nr:dipeptidase [Micropepsaceae bacterium]
MAAFRVTCGLALAAVMLLPSAGWAAGAPAIHQHILTLDTHMDTPMNFARPGWDIMDEHSVDGDLSQVDYPRMVKGGLDGGFFAIFIPQGPLTPEGYAAARAAGLKREAEIRDMVRRHSDVFELALRADDAERIVKSGKRVVYQSMENSYPLGTDLTSLKRFYDLGVRMLGPVHFTNNEFADSATDPKGPEWHGLSPLGKQLVAEANRLGIILDASHASDETFDQMLALSTTPVVLSHSSARAVFNHPRNIDDARILKLAAAGGVIQINSYSDYLVDTPDNHERDQAMRTLGRKYGPYRSLSGDKLKSYMAERHAIEASYPLPRATIDDVMAHLLHVLRLVGPDHAGIGLDWDGGGGVSGMEDVAGIPEISKRLLAAGYTEQDVAKIWGGNILRVMRVVEAKAEMPAH